MWGCVEFVVVNKHFFDFRASNKNFIGVRASNKKSCVCQSLNIACGDAVASAKSLSAMRGASHQSAYVSCLTISNTRLPYLPSR